MPISGAQNPSLPNDLPVRYPQLIPKFQLNARGLTQSLTGVQRYAEELYERLSGHLTAIQPLPGWGLGARGHLWEQFWLPQFCDRRLLWSPGNTGPLARGNQVVTIHDASTLDHPEWFDRKFSRWYQWLLPRLARRVRAIITVSHFSKERLVPRLGIDDTKIHVVPNGLSRNFGPQRSSDSLEVLQELGLRKPFFLYVGSVEPRKTSGVCSGRGEKAALKNWSLIIAGDRPPIFDAVKLPVNVPGVEFTGRLENPELLALYSSAHAFASATVYEGFGFSPLEAMACGCPCVVSDIPAHREVCGDAPIYVPATSVHDWADALRDAAGWSLSVRERRSQNGLRITGQFSWAKSASQTLEILNSLSSP